MDTLATAEAIMAAAIDLTRISTIILLILGNVGEILNFVIFVQRTFRNNPCAIYFLAASCARLFFINYVMVLNDITLGKLKKV